MGCIERCSHCTAVATAVVGLGDVRLLLGKETVSRAPHGGVVFPTEILQVETHCFVKVSSCVMLLHQCPRNGDCHNDVIRAITTWGEELEKSSFSFPQTQKWSQRYR